ncbi:MAG: hypothetical protein FWD96_03040 [Defluviitaleaceae bacterium]|nr:hypothetical protein [Defluviitaleaceae bacterium]
MRKKIITAMLAAVLCTSTVLLAVAANAQPMVTTLAGASSHNTHAGGDGNFNLPAAVFGGDDQLFVVDTFNNVIRGVNASGDAQLVAGSVLALDATRFPAGRYSDGCLQSALFNRPTDGVVSPGGRIIIADSLNHAIRIIQDDQVLTFAGGERAGMINGSAEIALFNHPTALAIDPQGNIYVADTLNHVIRMITPDGMVSTFAGMPGLPGYADSLAMSSRFYSPMGIAVSADGARVYVADTGNHLIRVIEDGEVRTLAGSLRFPSGAELVDLELDDDDWATTPLGGFANGTGANAVFNLPMGLALHGDNLIVADSANHMIRSVTPTGEVTILAGIGLPDYINGPADQAAFHMPRGVFVRDRELFVADTGNNLVRRIVIEPASYSLRPDTEISDTHSDDLSAEWETMPATGDELAQGDEGSSVE